MGPRPDCGCHAWRRCYGTQGGGYAGIQGFYSHSGTSDSNSYSLRMYILRYVLTAIGDTTHFEHSTQKCLVE